MIVRMTVMVLMMLMFCSRQGYAFKARLRSRQSTKGTNGRARGRKPHLEASVQRPEGAAGRGLHAGHLQGRVAGGYHVELELAIELMG